MNAPANLQYTKSDEWFDPATGAMGLSDYVNPSFRHRLHGNPVDEGDVEPANRSPL
jgi:hypothetical protein